MAPKLTGTARHRCESSGIGAETGRRLTDQA